MEISIINKEFDKMVGRLTAYSSAALHKNSEYEKVYKELTAKLEALEPDLNDEIYGLFTQKAMFEQEIYFKMGISLGLKISNELKELDKAAREIEEFSLNKEFRNE